MFSPSSCQLRVSFRSFTLNYKDAEGAAPLIDFSAVVISECMQGVPMDARLGTSAHDGDKQLLMASAHAHAGREGTILDVVHKHKPSALDFAIVSSRDKDIWPEGLQEVVGDDVIHVLPKKLDPAAEVRDELGAGWGEGRLDRRGRARMREHNCTPACRRLMACNSQPCVRGWLRAGWKGMQEQRRLATVKGEWSLFTAPPP